jgi:hypothetical protein
VNGRGRNGARIASAAVACFVAVVGSAARAGVASPAPEPSPPFGRVIYRAAKVAALESTGVAMIACRHRDPTPRRFAVQFFDDAGRVQQTFGVWKSSPLPAGRKVTFITDGLFFKNRPADFLNVRLGHLAIGTARVISDARVVRCIGKMRMDPGFHAASHRDEIGLVREGAPLPVMSRIWDAPRRP